MLKLIEKAAQTLLMTHFTDQNLLPKHQNALKLADILWNRTSVEVVDKLSSTTVDFIRSERELENMCLFGV